MKHLFLIRDGGSLTLTDPHFVPLYTGDFFYSDFFVVRYILDRAVLLAFGDNTADKLVILLCHNVPEYRHKRNSRAENRHVYGVEPEAEKGSRRLIRRFGHVAPVTEHIKTLADKIACKARNGLAEQRLERADNALAAPAGDKFVRVDNVGLDIVADKSGTGKAEIIEYG